MNKKKLLVIILLIALILIVIFLGNTIRKMIIIKDLNQKVARYENSENHYEKIINNSGATETITEYYCKGDNAVLFLNTTIKDTGETKKLTNYFKGGKTNTYIETEEEKIVLLDSNALPSKIMIHGLDYGNNIWYLFQMAVVTSIKSGEHNGKECYIISLGDKSVTYIEKETGLRVKAKEGVAVDQNGNETDIIVEYYYEFDNVDDSIFIEPDINEYTIQEND